MFGHLQKGHAFAFGDIDTDGDEDVFEEMGGAASGDNYPSVLYENPGHGNHWIKLELEGVKTNRAAFGARVNVTVKTGGGMRHVYRTVGYGSSFGGNPLRQHVGVGKAERIAGRPGIPLARRRFDANAGSVQKLPPAASAGGGASTLETPLKKILKA